MIVKEKLKNGCRIHMRRIQLLIIKEDFLRHWERLMHQFQEVFQQG